MTGNFEDDCRVFDTRLGVERNYDVVGRDLALGTRRARLWFVDGYADDAVTERMMSFLLSQEASRYRSCTSAEDFAARFISFDEVNIETDDDAIVIAVLAGKLLLLVEKLDAAIIIDAKSYPSRSVEEPSDSRVLRGAHDGFVEALIHNTALLRRRIRDERLTVENMKVGAKSHTDIAICYIDGLADEVLLAELRQKLRKMQARSFTMGQESVVEALQKRGWWNPMPRARYTERPDGAAACVLEGDIVLLVDGSPSALLLPTRFMDFIQEPNDYYFPPLVGSYLRLVRLVTVILSLLITPLWYLLVSSPDAIPARLHFLAIEGECYVPLIVQLLIVELIVDVLKLASLNTPEVLSGSFSMLGALILGDFAVQSRWLVPEVLVYMAFVAIAGFSQPSYELTYAMKLFRLTLLLLGYFFSWYGFAAGLLLIVCTVSFTKPLIGRSYLHGGRRRGYLLLRHPISKSNT